MFNEDIDEQRIGISGICAYLETGHSVAHLTCVLAVLKEVSNSLDRM